MTDQSLIDRYVPFLRSRLTPPRLQHCVGVMDVMADLALIYALDRTRAMTAGLLHDIAKDLSGEEQLALATDAGITWRHSCERHPVYLHATVGAYLVAEEVGITDRQILDAIAAHSYVDRRQNLRAPLSQCLRFADLLAPVHPWAGMQKLKRLVYAGRQDEAALLQSAWLLEYFHEHQIPVHPDLANEYETRMRSVTVDVGFFDRSGR